MSRNYIPLPQRVSQYFAGNPNDWLSVEDVMVKFSVNENSARHLLAECTRSGKVERVSVYRTVVPRVATVSEQVSAEVSKP